MKTVNNEGNEPAIALIIHASGEALENGTQLQALTLVIRDITAFSKLLLSETLITSENTICDKDEIRALESMIPPATNGIEEYLDFNTKATKRELVAILDFLICTARCNKSMH